MFNSPKLYSITNVIMKSIAIYIGDISQYFIPSASSNLDHSYFLLILTVYHISLLSYY